MTRGTAVAAGRAYSQSSNSPLSLLSFSNGIFPSARRLGLIYLASRRNLTTAIVAQGVSDTLDAFLFFIGHYPGM